MLGILDKKEKNNEYIKNNLLNVMKQEIEDNLDKYSFEEFCNIVNVLGEQELLDTSIITKIFHTFKNFTV